MFIIFPFFGIVFDVRTDLYQVFIVYNYRNIFLKE